MSVRVISWNDQITIEVQVRVLHFYTPYRKFCLQNLYLLVSEEIWVATPHKCFSFQVIYSTALFLHNTLTIEMTLFLNSFILWSIIPTGCISKDKSSLSSTGGASKTCDRFEIHFLNMETWNTSCIRSKSRSNSNRQATGPILSRILNGSIYQGFNLPRFWNWMTHF